MNPHRVPDRKKKAIICIATGEKVWKVPEEFFLVASDWNFDSKANEASQCNAWAEEAAMSRVYGGIHYRFDAEVGIDQGKKVAKYTVDKAKLDGAD